MSKDQDQEKIDTEDSAIDITGDDEVEVEEVTVKKKSHIPSKLYNFGSFTGVKTKFDILYHERPLLLEYKHSLSFPYDQDSLPIFERLQTQDKPIEYWKLEKSDTERQRKTIKQIASTCVGDNPSPEDLRSLYILANQLLLYREKTKICLLCVREKDEYPSSHIFPESLLKAYKGIHCPTASNFISDVSSGKPKTIGVKQLSYPLFCSKCENKASAEEAILKCIYLQIMSCGESERLHITSETFLKLQHVLAILMFRGILMGVNFVKEIAKGAEHFSKFFKVFLEIRKYCLQEGYAPMAGSCSRLFLLPNRHFNPINVNPTYILDFQLHNPQFTSVLIAGDASFFYTKFDCFHLCLPFRGEIDFLSENKSYFMQQGFYSCDEAIRYFPRELFLYNISQTESLLCLLVDSKVPKNIQVIIEMFQNQPKEDSIPYHSGSQESTNEKTIMIKESLDRDECKKMLSSASGASPFKDHHAEFEKLLRSKEEKLDALLIEAEEEKLALKKKVDSLMADNEQLKETISTLRSEAKNKIPSVLSPFDELTLDDESFIPMSPSQP